MPIYDAACKVGDCPHALRSKAGAPSGQSPAGSQKSEVKSQKAEDGAERAAAGGDFARAYQLLVEQREAERAAAAKAEADGVIVALRAELAELRTGFEEFKRSPNRTKLPAAMDGQGLHPAPERGGPVDHAEVIGGIMSEIAACGNGAQRAVLERKLERAIDEAEKAE